MKNVAKTRTKEQLIADYKELFDTKVFLNIFSYVLKRFTISVICLQIPPFSNTVSLKGTSLGNLGYSRVKRVANCIQQTSENGSLIFKNVC